LGEALLETNIAGLPVRRGKVRDVYDLGDGRLLIVATDRISAYDWVLPTGIPDKGRILTGISEYWFVGNTTAGSHFLSSDVDDAGLDVSPEVRATLIGRSMLVKKAEVIPFECVVRGYLAGSAWREYRTSGSACDQRLPAGLVEGDRIEPMFTPATKAEVGHDENVSLAEMARTIGDELAQILASYSIDVYRDAASYARDRGLILADTKFEWGLDPHDGKPMLVDELLTPDSSRYWPLEGYRPGRPQPSFDKQYVRDWLDASGWDKASPPPALPGDVVAKTRAKYIQAYEILTGQAFPWT